MAPGVLTVPGPVRVRGVLRVVAGRRDVGRQHRDRQLHTRVPGVGQDTVQCGRLRRRRRARGREAGVERHHGGAEALYGEVAGVGGQGAQGEQADPAGVPAARGGRQGGGQPSGESSA